MKLGIGVRAGLTVGLIYILLYIVWFILEASAKSIFLVSLFLDIFAKEDYFRSAVYMSFLQLHRRLRGSDIMYSNIYTEVEFIPFYAGYIIVTSIIFEKIFQRIHTRLPSKSNTIKTVGYGLLLWLGMGIVSLVLYFLQPFVRVFFWYLIPIPNIKDFISYISSIFYWLLYGFLLGRFYDVFSKEPDVGIFYMIKKVFLRKS